jgi:hypothetical protein
VSRVPSYRPFRLVGGTSADEGHLTGSRIRVQAWIAYLYPGAAVGPDLGAELASEVDAPAFDRCATCSRRDHTSKPKPCLMHRGAKRPTQKSDFFFQSA